MRLSHGPAPLVILAVLLPFSNAFGAPSSEDLFRRGVEAYRVADYAQAAESFRQAAALRPASGTLQNLGNAEWQHGQVGPAVLAWEQTLWLDAFNQGARGNLRLARKVAQLDTPDLAWYEVISTWLPVNWWAWITGASLWLAVGMGLLPGVLGLRKSAWQQAAAALGLALFLLSVPAQLGVMMRARVAFVLQKDTPLRRTPTLEAEERSRLGVGESLRVERTRGNYYLVRTRMGVQGWVARREVGLICPRP